MKTLHMAGNQNLTQAVRTTFFVIGGVLRKLARGVAVGTRNGDAFQEQSAKPLFHLHGLLIITLLLTSVSSFSQSWQKKCPDAITGTQCSPYPAYVGYTHGYYDHTNNKPAFILKKVITGGGIYGDSAFYWTTNKWDNGSGTQNIQWTDGVTVGTNDCTIPPPAGSNYPLQRHFYRLVALDRTHNGVYLGPGANGTCPTPTPGDPYDVFFYNFSTGNMTQIASSIKPAAGDFKEAAWAYHRGTDTLVMYVGNANLQNDLYICTFDGSRNLTCPTSPTNTNATPGSIDAPAMVECNGDVYLYGGRKSGSAATAEGNPALYLPNTLYKFNGLTTSSANFVSLGATGSPPGTWFPNLVCDANHNRLLLHWPAGDAVSNLDSSTSQVWSYDIATNAWTNLNINGGCTIRISSPQAYRQTITAVFDDARNTLVETCAQVSGTQVSANPEVWELAFTEPVVGSGITLVGSAGVSGGTTVK